MILSACSFAVPLSRGEKAHDAAGLRRSKYRRSPSRPAWRASAQTAASVSRSPLPSMNTTGLPARMSLRSIGSRTLCVFPVPVAPTTQVWVRRAAVAIRSGPRPVPLAPANHEWAASAAARHFANRLKLAGRMARPPTVGTGLLSPRQTSTGTQTGPPITAEMTNGTSASWISRTVTARATASRYGRPSLGNGSGRASGGCANSMSASVALRTAIRSAWTIGDTRRAATRSTGAGDCCCDAWLTRASGMITSTARRAHGSMTTPRRALRLHGRVQSHAQRASGSLMHKTIHWRNAQIARRTSPARIGISSPLTAFLRSVSMGSRPSTRPSAPATRRAW
jgi:hypothetical protein